MYVNIQVRNMFAKMITFLCVSTNQDPPIEVSVTTNAGTGEREQYEIEWKKFRMLVLEVQWDLQ